MKKISILGSTGSIGSSTTDIVRKFADRYRIVALTARNSITPLVGQIREFRPLVVAVASESAARDLKTELGAGCSTDILHGVAGYEACASLGEADVVVSAIVGTAGLRPTLAAVQAGKTVALANKESLVVAGSIIRKYAEASGATIIPVDSEHSAVFQCLAGHPRSSVRKVVLTASGGAFRDFGPDELRRATAEQALRHPNWSMGPKITVDSATLMNKGLEVIEARWLFDLEPDEIDVLIHPQSIVHSMVEFVDGSLIAQLGVPDMKGPIAYALSFPERLRNATERLNLAEAGTLTFREPDTERFPCLAYAYEALHAGGNIPAAMNAANEVAVAAFLQGEIDYPGIASTIRQVMDATAFESTDTLEALERTVHDADERARRVVSRIAAAGATQEGVS